MVNKITPIKNGTVIDHIDADKFRLVYAIIRTPSLEDVIKKNPASIATNVSSKKYGLKDIIMLENIYLTKDQLNKIKIISENVTINIVKDEKVIEKYNLELPKELQNILICRNSPMYYEDDKGHTRARGGCISYKHAPETGLRIEPIPYHHILSKEGPDFEYVCYFCERKISKKEISKYLILNLDKN